MSKTGPSGVAVRGVAEVREGGAEFTCDAENQESVTVDAVAETETGRSL